MAGSESRLEPTDTVIRHVWAASAGRCAICKQSVLSNEFEGLTVPIGELAHAVGQKESSPRGLSPLTREQRREADNLILLCRNCHKPADDKSVYDVYSVDRLLRIKREHEEAVYTLTGIDPNQRATILRLVGEVRGVHPSLSYQATLRAVTGAGLYPKLLNGANSSEVDIDLSGRAQAGTPQYYQGCAVDIDEKMRQVNDGIRRGDIERLAVFGFARIPLLVHLGARLDDKIPTNLFQRQRSDEANPWSWPSDAGATPDFRFTHELRASGSLRVALVVNLSGTISREDLDPLIEEATNLYVLAPCTPFQPGPTLLNSPQAVQNFEATARAFLAHIEQEYGRIPQIDLFGAIPLAAAITLGRVLMPNVSPAWQVWDRNGDGRFIPALEVRR